MKIALLGAPGSGKTKIARKTISLLKQTDPKWGIVDGYTDQLVNQTGIPLNLESNPLYNVSVITTRWIKEATLENQGLSSITCGTIYETFLYATFSTMFVATDELQMAQDNVFNQIILQTLGAFEKKSWDYDAIFLLPLDPKTFTETVESRTAQFIDAKLPEVLDGFNKIAVRLDEKTDKAKAETIIKIIGKINDVHAKLLAANEQ